MTRFMHAATDDRCANFSASTCPTEKLKLRTSFLTDKLPLEKFHRLLDLVFWGNIKKYQYCVKSPVILEEPKKKKSRNKSYRLSKKY
jgi:hypothetical protein